jgi:hypothetical protein
MHFYLNIRALRLPSTLIQLTLCMFKLAASESLPEAEAELHLTQERTFHDNNLSVAPSSEPDIA